MSGEKSGDALSLDQKLRNALTIVSAGLLAMALWVVTPSFLAYVQAENDLVVIRGYEGLLVAAQHLSIERGLSGIVMSSDPGTNATASRESALKDARRETDAALAAAGANTMSVPRQSMILVREELANARAQVDRVAVKPLATRTVGEIRLGMDGLITAVDAFHPVIASAATVLQQRNPALAGPASVAYAVSDLREFGGRIGAYLVPSVTRRVALTVETVDLVNRTHGRVEQLMAILQAQAIILNEPYKSLMRKVRMIFAGQGLRLVDTLMLEGRAGGSYSMEPAAFPAFYISTLAPLETLRKTAIQGMVEHVSETRNAALWHLLGMSLVTLLLLIVPVRLMYRLFQSVLRPLLAARDMIVGLAEEKSVAPSVSTQNVRELHNLFEAIARLRVKLAERRELTEQLRVQADTDSLTGLINRSSFGRIGMEAMSEPGERRLGVHYLDLDGFKPVNDTFGHFAGDLLLKEVASRLILAVGGLGQVARLGGDEFAVCATGLDRDGHEQLARRLLAAFEEPFPVEDRLIPVGASIGVALRSMEDMDFGSLCQRADIALYAAKSSGRKTFRFFNPAIEPPAPATPTPAIEPSVPDDVHHVRLARATMAR